MEEMNEERHEEAQTCSSWLMWWKLARLCSSESFPHSDSNQGNISKAETTLRPTSSGRCL